MAMARLGRLGFSSGHPWHISFEHREKPLHGGQRMLAIAPTLHDRRYRIPT